MHINKLTTTLNGTCLLIEKRVTLLKFRMTFNTIK